MWMDKGEGKLRWINPAKAENEEGPYIPSIASSGAYEAEDRRYVMEEVGRLAALRLGGSTPKAKGRPPRQKIGTTSLWMKKSNPMAKGEHPERKACGRGLTTHPSIDKFHPPSSGNMKKYVGNIKNMKEYDGTCGKYEEICEKYKEI